MVYQFQTHVYFSSQVVQRLTQSLYKNISHNANKVIFEQKVQSESSTRLLLAEPRQPRNEVTLSVRLGDPDALPGLQLVGVDQQGEDGHHEAVPHVPDADNLNNVRISSAMVCFLHIPN